MMEEVDTPRARTITLYLTGTFLGLGDSAIADRVFDAIEPLGVLGVSLPIEEGE